ncbi:hypothetical protein F4824DRAFT_500590 [Ustulina deusta]|nr:hypothetical protein F4824DRAFT_500590 [Ustulina deusta]
MRGLRHSHQCRGGRAPSTRRLRGGAERPRAIPSAAESCGECGAIRLGNTVGFLKCHANVWTNWKEKELLRTPFGVCATGIHEKTDRKPEDGWKKEETWLVGKLVELEQTGCILKLYDSFHDDVPAEFMPCCHLTALPTQRRSQLLYGVPQLPIGVDYVWNQSVLFPDRVPQTTSVILARAAMPCWRASQPADAARLLIRATPLLWPNRDRSERTA